ncbi:MAG: hypothetical protein KC656_09460, partial [Myxococcales bacterium]|nr:hypothetical protein [Myxococcales bacterium]
NLTLTGITGYVLSQIETSGRRSFALWSFDPYVDQPGRSIDPISVSMADSSAFPTIVAGEVLVPVTNYVLVVNDALQTWRVFSFDPQLPNPLSYPMVSSGTLPAGVVGARIVAFGDLLYCIQDGQQPVVYRFTPVAPFGGQVPGCSLPEGMELDERTRLVAAVRRPEATEAAEPATPGTMAFMQEKIQHVVVYVLESRSFDSVLGWLYDAQTAGSINWVGTTGTPTFEGASTSNTNTDAGVVYPQNQYADGTTGSGVTLDSPVDDPFHDTPDAIHQQWSGGYASYQANNPADMSGFVQNNGSAEVMTGFTPNQLPILNGLASGFAVSDMWFCSEAGATTTNRATLATGSALDITVSYEGGDAYTFFPDRQHRQSVWKVLSNFAISDWAIYYSVLWEGYPYTYHLYLEGQLPSVDAYPTGHVKPIQSFYDDITNQTLPRFSFLEPVWYDPSGVFTSYHPTGDVLPGEQALEQIYEAIANSPTYRENTVLVISFSKGGGMYDHVPAARMKRAWPNDGNDGYGFDVTGTRVPTIVVSPYVKPNTVFRSSTGVPYDSTSLAATVLTWLGIPRELWGMGDRIHEAPTFEAVFQNATARTDVPTFTRAADATWPAGTPIPTAAPTPVSSTWQVGIDNAWTSYQNWSGGNLPTDVATFGSTGATGIVFAYNDPQLVNSIQFTADAQAYTFTFDEEQAAAPMLTIAGAGVANASSNTQTFDVYATSTATDQIQLAFQNTAGAGPSTITYNVGPTTPGSQSGGIIAFQQASTAGAATFVVTVGSRRTQGYATVGGEVRFLDDSNAGTATLTAYGSTGNDSDTFGNIVFHNRAKAANAYIVNVGGNAFVGEGGSTVHGDGGNTQFYEMASADQASIDNFGGTGGSGGDTAFDGTATAGNATIVNRGAASGYGGVTSFNNNKPYMSPWVGATAGNASITNLGASSTQTGSGGHTEFTGIYGAGSAGEATIANWGSEQGAAQSQAGGYTLFAVNGHWPYCQPTAWLATIDNHPGQGPDSVAGSTQFKYQDYEGHGKTDAAGPTAYHATITNHGAGVAGAPGGYTLFDDHATAGSATITSQPGTVAGAYGGSTIFQGSATSERASLSASGNTGMSPGTIVYKDQATAGYTNITLSAGGLLDLGGSLNATLELASLFISTGTIEGFAGKTVLVVDGALSLYACSFVFLDTAAPTTTVTVLQSPSLTAAMAAQCTGNPVGGKTPHFTVSGTSLQVTFQ